jgi:hypothetical protein
MLSVHRRELTTLEAIREQYPNFSVARIVAKAFRDLGYDVIPDPLEAKEGRLADPSHAQIPPLTGKTTISKGDAKILAGRAEFEYEMTEGELAQARNSTLGPNPDIAD